MISAILNFTLVFYSFLVILSIYIIHKLTTYKFNLESKFGFCGPKPLPLIGNFLGIMKHGFHVYDLMNQKKYGHIYPLYFGQIGQLVVSDEAILQQILVTEAKSFLDRPVIQGSFTIMNKNLLHLKGKDWERVRALVSPTFSSGNLRKISPMIVISVNEMVKKFSEAANNDIDMNEIFHSFSIDVIAQTTFGLKLDVSSSSSDYFIKYTKKLCAVPMNHFIFMMITFFPCLSNIVEYMYPKGLQSPEAVKYFEKLLISEIKKRRHSKEEFHDFLALMTKACYDIDESLVENKIKIPSLNSLNDEEIIAQAVLFLLIGYECTAYVLRFSSYYLAMNQEMQNEIYQELKRNLSFEQEITFDIISKLHLLDQCFQETLRIIPHGARFGRVCDKDTILTSSTGQIIRASKGMTFFVPMYAIHHDARIWPDPEKFDIHRFDYEEKQKRSPFSHMPFGMGPRNCFAMPMFFLEVKLALACLLTKFKIMPCEKTPKELSFGAGGMTSVKEPVILKLEIR